MVARRCTNRGLVLHYSLSPSWDHLPCGSDPARNHKTHPCDCDGRICPVISVDLVRQNPVMQEFSHLPCSWCHVLMGFPPSTWRFLCGNPTRNFWLKSTKTESKLRGISISCYLKTQIWQNRYFQASSLGLRAMLNFRFTVWVQQWSSDVLFCGIRTCTRQKRPKRSCLIVRDERSQWRYIYLNCNVHADCIHTIP